MKIHAKLGALLGAAVLLFALAGMALAVVSHPLVTPTWHSGNITVSGSNGGGDSDSHVDTLSCSGDAAEFTGSGSQTTTGGVTITFSYNGTTKESSFTTDGGVALQVYIKGGNAYNEYDYDVDPYFGTTSDSGLVAPDNGSGKPAGLSHALFCVEPGEESAPPSFDLETLGETQHNTSADLAGSNTGSSPSDASWLLVVAMGVLLASAVVLTPARLRNRK